MSLRKPVSRIKEGVKELGSPQGIKRVAVHFGLGVALGAILDLILQYIMLNLINPNTDQPTYIVGFNIMPNHVIDGEPVLFYDDILLILLTVMMLFTKKLWFVVGFFTGWYFSSYMGLYDSLNLPKPEVIP